MRQFLATVAVSACFAVSGSVVHAGEVDDLLDALGVPQIVEIMRAEG